MTPDELLPVDGRQLFALAVVFVVVASLSGGATYAVLSDTERATAEVSVEAGGINGMYQTQSISCDAVDPDDAPEFDSDEFESIQEFDVPGADGCALVSIWLSPSWFGDTDPSDAVIGHKTDGEWQILETTVGEETGTTVRLDGKTAGFSPFAVFVPNDSQPEMPVAPGEAGNDTDSDGDVGEESVEDGGDESKDEGTGEDESKDEGDDGGTEDGDQESNDGDGDDDSDGDEGDDGDTGDTDSDGDDTADDGDGDGSDGDTDTDSTGDDTDSTGDDTDSGGDDTDSTGDGTDGDDTQQLTVADSTVEAVSR